MFKGFNDIQGFNGVPSLQFQSKGRSLRPLYGKEKASFWLHANDGIPSGTVDGALIASWNDLIFKVGFQQLNSTWQPTWRASDPDFGGNPIVHFTSNGRHMIGVDRNGPTIGTSQTLALVYQYINQSIGLYATNSILGNIESSFDLRWTYRSFSHNAPHTNNLGVGYWVGSGNTAAFINGSTAIFDLLPRIIVLSGQALISNGVSITKTNNGVVAFTANSIGAPNTGSPANAIGTMKFAEAIVWNENYSVSDCLDISAELNAKYAIY